MTKFQRIAISVGGLLLALNAIFPPVTFESRPQYHDRGFIFTLGEFGTIRVGRDSPSGTMGLDLPRWLLWSTVIIGLTIAVVFFPRAAELDEPTRAGVRREAASKTD